MSKTSSETGIERIVEYLEESDEPVSSKVRAVKNAVETGDFTVDDVLSGYADSLSEDDAIYPMHESELRELHDSVAKELDEYHVSDLRELCKPSTLIETKDDVVTQAISIYTNTSTPDEERQNKIKTLIKDARRDGIAIEPEEVLRSLREFAASTQQEDVGTVSVGMENVTLATDVETPSEVVAGEEYVYRVNIEDGVEIDSIDWYIGGTRVGEGKTVLHTFEYPGIYTVSVEITDEKGRTDHINEEVDVADPSKIEVDIDGQENVDAGESVQYKANVTAQGEQVHTLEWEINGVAAGKGKVFNNTFENDGSHTLSVTAHADSGLTVTEDININVQTPTNISAEIIEAPDTVYIGDEAEIHCEIDVENSFIEDTTFKIGDEVIDIDESSLITVTHTFDEPGEYPVTVTATNNVGDTDTGVTTIQCRVKAEVELEEHPTEVVRGDTETFVAKFDDRLTSRWGVSDASLTQVGDQEASVTFNSGIADTATVTIEVENESGETATETVEITVHEPTVSAEITYPDEIIAGNTIAFSTEGTEVEHAEIQQVEWKLGDGMVIGNGEKTTHEFSSPGEYTAAVTVQSDRNVSDTARETIEVEPETDVTAVIISQGGGTTRDEFTFDAKKSVAENTEIKSYEWIFEDETEATGKTVTKSFSSPGDYTVELTVETEAGDVDTDETTVSVAQYTEVNADITGPTEVEVGKKAKFTARASKPVNTTISDYNWMLNEQPVGSGEEFTQTFSTPGHYTVALEVISATDDTDTDSVGVVVNKPAATVTAGFEIENEPQLNTGSVANVTATPSEVKNGEIQSYTWKVDDDEIATDGENAELPFTSYGTKSISLTVTAVDGTTDTVDKEVYVSPSIDNPPYELLSEDASKADVFARVVDIYQDELLTQSDQNRFASHLLLDAKSSEIGVTKEDLEEHIADVGVVDVEIVKIDAEKFTEEWEGRTRKSIGGGGSQEDEGEWEISTDAEESGSETSQLDEADKGEFVFEDEEGDEDESEGDDSEDPDGLEGSWDVNSEANEGISGVSDAKSLEDQESAELDLDDEDGEENVDGDDDTSQEQDEDDEGTTKGDGEPEKDDEESEGIGETDHRPEVSDEEIEEYQKELVDSDKDDLGENHKTDRTSPETYDLGGSVLSMPNYAQDLVDFEYILDKDDDLMPGDANGAGVVVAEDDRYIAIARVEGRDWSIHTPQKKQDIVGTYESHVLSSLDNHIQILSIPTRFDLREHVELVKTVLEENEDNSEELLMNIGRSIYPNWLESFMEQNDMKERQFYIVMAMSAEQLHKFKGSGESLIEGLTELPGVGGFFERFADSTADDITKYQCLRELNTRFNRLEGNLRRMEVKMDRVESRSEAMAVLFHYYNNMEPTREVFPTGPFTQRDQEATIGGVNIDHLLEKHEPAHEGVEAGGMQKEGDKQ